MKYIQSRFTFILTGVIGIILIAVACSDTMQTDTIEPAGVDDLTQSVEFKSMISSVEQFNAPMVEKLKSMSLKELTKLREEFSSKIDSSGPKPIFTGNLEQVAKKLGYKDAQQYRQLWESVGDKMEKFRNAFPKVKSGAINKAAFQISKNNNPKDTSNTEAVLDGHVDYCYFEVYVPCIEDDLATVGWGTAGCFAVGVFGTPLAGAACQIINIAAFETQKYLCWQQYRGCMDCYRCEPENPKK